MICRTYDDLLEPHVAEYIESEIRKVHWKYDYDSNKRIGIQSHWHVFCGEDEKSVTQNGYDYLLPIWESAAYKLKLEEIYKITGWKRLYMNAHTNGVEPHIHIDDIGNRLLIFPAHNFHQAMPVSKYCFELRPVVVFKCFVKGGNVERLDFYKN